MTKGAHTFGADEEQRSISSSETRLATLLTSMQPALHKQAYIFASLSPEAYAHLPFAPRCSFHEAEGVTVIATQAQADSLGIAYDGTWACITLRVYSALSAVGFLAAVTTRLAHAGISVNPVSAYNHDHLFVPWGKRRLALEELEKLAKEGNGE